ncbi:MAG: hypothetical protein ABSD39_02890 [Terriglobales bacterium]|jgi:parallel beta-helix repeat protein
MKIAASRFAVIAMMFAVVTLLVTGLASAEGVPPQCPSTITSCGCTIGAHGNYELGNNLYAYQGLTLKNSCIDIDQLHVNLNLNGYDIFGPGNTEDCQDTQKPFHRQALGPLSKSNFGVGIHVMPGAENVEITSGLGDDGGDFICGWNYGLESEGTNVSVSSIFAGDNNVGFLFNNATDNACVFCDGGYNVTGLQISGGSGNTLNNTDNGYNSQYGFWIDGSKHNQLTENNAFNNGIAGYYMGCSSTGNVKPLIPCTESTNTGNSLIFNGAYDNGRYGIAVERQSFWNSFSQNATDMDGTKDIIDGDGNCVYNSYQGDEYGTKSPSCIE